MTIPLRRCYASPLVARASTLVVRPCATGLAALLVLAAAGIEAARAQAPGPSDVADGWSSPATGVELPPPPDGFLVETRGDVTWVFHERTTPDTRDLMRAFDGAWNEVTSDLGGDVDDEMVIRVARDPEEMARLAPVGHPPPEYASGVAYPRFGVILLTLTAPSSWKRPPMRSLLTHELSHVALRRAVGPRPLPRWFVEGVAIHQAREYSLPRARALWEATFREDLVALSELDRGFPSRPHEVNLAYAESADFVRFLRDDDRGQRRFRTLLRRLSDGEAFPDAIEAAYRAPLSELEREWRAELEERYGEFPLMIGGGTVWVLASALLIVAWARRRRRKRERLAQWQADEDRIDRLERIIDDRLAHAREPEGVVDPADRSLVVSGDPPDGREPGVPTVEHEGHDHTLH